VKECGYIVPAILSAPSAIFEGLRRDEDDDKWGCGWRCYCGIPQCAYTSGGSEIPVYRDQVYLVFVNDEKVAYNWRWEKCEPGEPTLPFGYSERFKTRLL
jgi:hypothetical protein